MNVNLRIERLILDGVDLAPGHRHLLGSVVEIELRRLLATNGLSQQLSGGGAIPVLASPAIQLQHNNGTGELGQKIAGAVHGVIGK